MAGIITAGAYTLASLGEFAVIPARIVPFLAILLGLLVLAHLAVRWLAAGADGTLLPLAALLHGLGYVMITRLDDRLAGLQTTWSLVAIAGFIATLVAVQRAPDLARYRWSFLLVGIVLLLLPLVPGLGFGVGGARIWVSLGPINFQPGEFAKLLLAIFFAGYLAENRELIAESTWRLGPVRLPEPRHLLPILLAWGFAVIVMVGQRDLGSSLLFFALFVVMMWVATERVELPAHRPRAVRRRGVRVVADVRARPDSRGHLARPVVRPPRQRLPDRAGAVRPLRRRHRRHRARPRQPEHGARGAERLHLHVDRRGARPARRDGRPDGLPADHRRRPAHRAAHGQHVREAARRRPDHDRRRAGVHHRRRRHQARPAHGDHAAVRQLRRVVAAVELHPAGPPHPAQRLGRPPPPRAARRPDARRALGGVAAAAGGHGTDDGVAA